MNQMLPQLKKPHLLKDAVFYVSLKRNVAEPCQCIAWPHSVKYSTLQAYSRGKIKSKFPVCVIQSHIRRVVISRLQFHRMSHCAIGLISNDTLKDFCVD